MKKLLLLTYLTICYLPCFAFDNLIVFGDSLSDSASLDKRIEMICQSQKTDCSQFRNGGKGLTNIGNNYWVRSPGIIGTPITSINPKTNLSNIWPNDFVRYYFSEKSKQWIYPASQRALLNKNPMTDNINYAYGSAESRDLYMNDAAWDKAHPYPTIQNQTVCDEHGPGLIKAGDACVPGLVKQVRLYLHDVNNRPNKKSLFILWIGGNDVINNITKIYLNSKSEKKPLILLKFYNAVYPITENGIAPLAHPITNTKKAVNLLLAHGVNPKQIYIIGLPDLSMTPAARRFTKGNLVALTVLHTLSDIYDDLLDVYFYYDFLHPSHNLPYGHIINLDGMINAIEYAPQRFGFTNTINSCEANGDKPYCAGYLFFNYKHPTVFAHQWVAIKVFDSINKK